MLLYLIGFMGAGKTTLGRALEARLPGWQYIDLDELIEQNEGMTVSQIFASKGEAYFRKIETMAVERNAGLQNTIIGCGGGTPCYANNMDFMNGHGITILLQASRPRLLRRLLEAQAQRPKLNGMNAAEVEQFIDHTIAERAQWYNQAQFRFSSDRLENESEIEETCGLFIRQFITGKS
jgi:shikimate kinase